MEELKPCPFCACVHPLMLREKLQQDERVDKKNVYVNSFCVVCLKCHSKSNDYRTEEAAIEAWNRRIE